MVPSNLFKSDCNFQSDCKGNPNWWGAQERTRIRRSCLISMLPFLSSEIRIPLINIQKV